MRARLLDLFFLLGILVKGIDGLIEVVGGIVLLARGVAQLDAGTTRLVAAYLLVHGVVKIAIVVALLLGSLKVYPWAVAALLGFLVFQVYELIAHPSVGIALLVVLDAAVVWLTGREWRRGRTLREAIAQTRRWVSRRSST